MKPASVVFLALILGALDFSSAHAAEKADIKSLLMQTDPAAQARLVDKAKKEGTVTFYTSITEGPAAKLRADFLRKYGIEINLWRAGDRTVLQKLMSESKSNVAGADIVNVGAIEAEMLHREKVLQPINSVYEKALMPGAIPAHKEWAATFVDVCVQAYNTDSVSKADLPKTYQDLLNPKWKGRLGLEGSDNEEWFDGVVSSMGEEKGLKYFHDLMQTNAPSLRNGHSLLGNLVIAGEVPLGLTVYDHIVLTAKKKGQPIDYVLLNPVIGIPFAEGITANAPHPYAALLFYQYMLTDGQKVLASLNYTPTRTDIPNPFQHVHYQIIDQSRMVDNFDHWSSLWRKIILKQ